MVSKEVRVNHSDYYARNAISKKVIPLSLRIKHTRESCEMNIALNCKNTTEKSLTRDQSITYNEILAEQRRKETKYMKRRKKDGKIVIPPKSSMIIEGQI